MARLLSQIERRGLKNIRLHRGDAVEVLDRLPDASLDRVYLFYPDPWPKRRQRKRRFVSADTLARLARTMHKGAELRFATDIDDYAAWTLARLRASPDFQWTAAAAADWLLPWDGWTQTKYESKAIAAGRKPVYLTFVARLGAARGCGATGGRGDDFQRYFEQSAEDAAGRAPHRNDDRAVSRRCAGSLDAPRRAGRFLGALVRPLPPARAQLWSGSSRRPAARPGSSR